MNKKYTLAQFMYILHDCLDFTKDDVIELYGSYKGKLWYAVEDVTSYADYEEFNAAVNRM